MLVAAKFGDPVLGVDIHMVLVPAPPAPPIPTPLPHPFIGVVFDPIGLAIGCLMSAVFGGGGPVLINSMPCGNTGTEVKGVPHFPTPPGISFAPNDIPGNEGVLFMGSMTVNMGGDSIARLTDMVISCNFPINLPTSVCLAVPMGPPVLVGGPPAINFMAAATQMIRTKWVSDQLHALLKAKPGSRLSKVICFLTGHPVDVMTGAVITDAVDFELPGPIPLRFERSYHSRDTYDGPLGCGWHHSADSAVIDEGWRVTVRLPDGRLCWHDPVDVGAATFDPWERYTLARRREGWTLTTVEGLTLRYAAAPGAAVARLSVIEDRGGNRVVFGYDGETLATAIDSAGRRLRFEHRGGRLTSVWVRRGSADADPWDELVRYEYDAQRLAAAYDPAGHALRYAYRGGVLTRETLRGGLSFHFEYDWEHPEGWCVRTWGDGGIYDRRIVYDKHRHVTAVEDSVGGRTMYFGNSAGLVDKQIGPLGAVRSWEWDPWLRPLAEVDPCGGRTERRFDPRGNVVWERDGLGHTSRWRYDDRDNVVEHEDPAGLCWRREYDARGLLVAELDPTGQAWRYQRDDGGRVVVSVSPIGQRVQLAYRSDGSLREVVDAAGAVTRFDHDDLGRLIAVTDPSGGRVTLQRDALGRTRAQAYDDGTRVELAYDADGNLTRVTDRDGVTTALQYVGLGRVAGRVDALGATVRLVYDTEERLVEVVNERGERYRIERDLAGDIVAEVAFDGRRTTSRLDPAGRAIEHTDARGRRSKLTRDALGRLIGVRYHDGSEEAFAYDPRGLLVAARFGEHSVELTRDAHGRVVRELANGHVVESAYDPAGRRVARASSFGERVQYDLDAVGRLRGVAVSDDPRWMRWEPTSLGDRGGLRGPWSASASRDATGRVTGQALPGGVTTAWRRDAEGRPQTHEVMRDLATLSAEGYAWSPAGRLTRRVDPERGATEYAYDPRGYLAGSAGPRGDRTVRAPDEVGDLFRDPSRSGRRYDAGGRLRSAEGRAYTWDADGRLVERVDADGARWRYAWDARDLLASVTRPDGAVVRYEYDALGRRVRKVYDGRAVEFVWDGDTLAHEVEPGGARVTWVFEPGGFTPLARMTETSRCAVVSDYLGVPTAMVNEGGAVVWQARSDVYGVARVEVGDEPCPWRWPGQYADDETGLHYNRFRYYAPDEGIYLSQDPIGLDGGLRAYGYVHDPMTWVDPFGLGSWKDKIRGVWELRDMVMRDAMKSRGVGGGTIAMIGNLADETVTAVAKLANQGDDAAETALKLLKQDKTEKNRGGCKR